MWPGGARAVSAVGARRRRALSHSHSADGGVTSQLSALTSPCVFPVRAQEPRDLSSKAGRESQLLECLSNKRTARR